MFSEILRFICPFISCLACVILWLDHIHICFVLFFASVMFEVWSSDSFWLLNAIISVTAIVRIRFSHGSSLLRWHHARSRTPDRTDVDECLEWSMCPGRCQNTIGSYICITMKSIKDAPYEACPPGYQWESRAGVCAGNDKLRLTRN